MKLFILWNCSLLSKPLGQLTSENALKSNVFNMFPFLNGVLTVLLFCVVKFVSHVNGPIYAPVPWWTLLCGNIETLQWTYPAGNRRKRATWRYCQTCHDTVGHNKPFIIVVHYCLWNRIEMYGSRSMFSYWSLTVQYTVSDWFTKLSILWIVILYVDKGATQFLV